MVPSSATKAAITVSMCNRKWELELGGTRHPEILGAHCSLLQDGHHHTGGAHQVYIKSIGKLYSFSV